jgi:Protein of unknown function (DUF3035)
MNKVFLFSVMSSVVILSGCGDTNIKQQLGLDRHSPDEFSVMQRAPLEIPADLKNLPLPQPGLQRPQDVTAKQKATQIILGTVEAPTNEATSAAEENLLQKTNAKEQNQDIRRQLAEESQKTQNDKRPVFKRLLNVGDSDPSAVVVDAKAEAKRIEDAKKSGQPVTTGETPVIEE